MNIIKKTALYVARKKYCKTAIEDRADLSAIREKPTLSMIVGLVLIAFSYVIGMPTVIALGVLAASMGKPMMGIIGGVCDLCDFHHYVYHRHQDGGEKIFSGVFPMDGSGCVGKNSRQRCPGDFRTRFGQ